MLQKVLLADVDGDRQPDIVVLARSAGTGGYQSAYAFAATKDRLSFIASVQGLRANADPVAALRLALVVLGDIVTANLLVARQVLGPPAALRPDFLDVPLDIVDPLVATILGSIVSLTPGTVSVEIDRAKRIATFTVKAPATAQPTDIAGIEAAGMNWWPLQMVRELDDAILHMRTNELDIGTWVLKTAGDAAAVLASDATMLANKDHWFVRETIGHLRRTLARMDVTSRSLFALVEEGTCFVGTLAELAFCADRAYMLALPDDEATTVAGLMILLIIVPIALFQKYQAQAQEQRR